MGNLLLTDLLLFPNFGKITGSKLERIQIRVYCVCACGSWRYVCYADRSLYAVVPGKETLWLLYKESGVVLSLSHGVRDKKLLSISIAYADGHLFLLVSTIIASCTASSVEYLQLSEPSTNAVLHTTKSPALAVGWLCRSAMYVAPRRTVFTAGTTAYRLRDLHEESGEWTSIKMAIWTNIEMTIFSPCRAIFPAAARTTIIETLLTFSFSITSHRADISSFCSAYWPLSNAVRCVHRKMIVHTSIRRSLWRVVEFRARYR